jgi:isocitrate lyase
MQSSRASCWPTTARRASTGRRIWTTLTIAKLPEGTSPRYGYKFQFITLAGFHALNYSMFNLAHGYARRQMSAFVELQEAEFAAAERGFTAVKHQREVGTGYFDQVTQTIQQGQSSTTALRGSTEEAQFERARKAS